MDKFCCKLQKIKIKKLDYIEIEEKAQPLYTFINWQEEWIIKLLASFHYISKNTEENSELKNFMAVHYEQVEDLHIYKKFLKPIETDNLKIQPSIYPIEKKYDRRCRLKKDFGSR
jgi:hypothetical protein